VKPERNQGMNRTSGRKVSGRLGLIAVLIAGALAADIATAEAPPADVYVVSAVLVPGAGGGEVCADVRGQGHVDFRVGFGADHRLYVNGVDAGSYDPHATYGVVVDCRDLGGQWFATTTVVNQGTGSAFHQACHPIPGAPGEVQVAAEDVLQVNVN
jgi:hypothetical protein